jgi:uncharacterized protein YebE (UPF0316 family)
MAINSIVLTTGVLIFVARVIDVSIGTMRTLSTIQGKTHLTFLLGLTEVSIWLFVISAVIKSISDNPILGLFYVLGFSTGNVVGILIERKLAFGYVNLRIFATENGNYMATQVRELGYPVTCFLGEGLSGPVTELYILCRRRDLQRIVHIVENVEPNVFFVTEPVGLMRKSGKQAI